MWETGDAGRAFPSITLCTQVLPRPPAGSQCCHLQGPTPDTQHPISLAGCPALPHGVGLQLLSAPKWFPPLPPP